MKTPFRIWRLIQISKWLIFFGFITAEVIIFEYSPLVAVLSGVVATFLLFPKKETVIHEVKITQKTPKVDPVKRYFELSEIIKYNKDIRIKLRACLASYKVLPYFVKYWLAENDELPPTILCRDVGVNLFMRAGQWLNAEHAIKTCAAAGLYPDNGHAALDYLHRYKKTVQVVIKFLQENEGFWQDRIYKALPDVDQDCLKDFTRLSFLIDKINFGKSNALYINKRFYAESDFLWHPD